MKTSHIKDQHGLKATEKPMQLVVVVVKHDKN